MLNDMYQNKTKFIFGKESDIEIISEIPMHANILLLYGMKSFKEYGLYDKITTLLEKNNFSYIELGGVEPNPKSALVYKGITLCKNNNIDYVLAVGGGSVIDSAKAVCAGSLYNGDFKDFYLKKAAPEKALPLGIILTNPGSGSETNNSSVITFEDYKQKLGMDFVSAEFVIMNPQNTISLPIHTTIYGIFDAITHILERFFSHTEFVHCSDEISMALIRTLIKHAGLIQKNPKNYGYRSEIMWACKLAMDKSLFLGRKGDWACHYIAHEIGAMSDITHAKILSVLYPTWMRYVVDNNHNTFKRFANDVMNEKDINLAIDNFEKTIKQLGMPTSLKELGFTDQDNFKKVAKSCSELFPSGTIGNFKRLTENDIIKLLNNAV